MSVEFATFEDMLTPVQGLPAMPVAVIDADKRHVLEGACEAAAAGCGDIATSPIYAIRECFHGEYGIAVSHANVMGILSLIFWALIMIVGLKYLIFVFRANNHGEGGVIALTALIRGPNRPGNRRESGVIILGLFAACILYEDGMITPAIFVLSAVEGIGVVTPVFDPYVIPITIAILIGLFLIQRHGTARVGGFFGPVILIWLCFLTVTGAVQVARTPQVLAAIFPWHAVRFLILNKLHGFVVLGAVFLLLDVPFFAANLSKILHGAWFPLVIGATFFTLMLTWAKGRRILADNLRKITPPIHQFIVDLGSHPPNIIEGDAVFLTGSRSAVPVALAKNVKHNHVVHTRTILLHFRAEDLPRIPSLEKIQTEKLGGGFYRIVARYGFMEDPSLANVFSLARGQGLALNPETTSFYIGHENLVIAEPSSMARWRSSLFMLMFRNAADATSFSRLPVDQVIEIGVRLAI
jgi:K+ transporter